MEFDKSWTKIRNRAKSQEFWNGLKAFINRVRPFVNDRGKIRCPCNKCLNGLTHSLETVEAHIFRYGFAESYITWIHHGEIEIPCENVNAQKNMVNRSHAKYPSVQGSNSFSATRYEKIDPETKQLPRPIDCFKEFHTFKSGNLVNTNATVHYDHLCEARETQQTLSSCPIDERTIVKEVLGTRGGHKRGIGWIPKAKAASTSVNSTVRTSHAPQGSTCTNDLRLEAYDARIRQLEMTIARLTQNAELSNDVSNDDDDDSPHDLGD